MYESFEKVRRPRCLCCKTHKLTTGTTKTGTCETCEAIVRIIPLSSFLNNNCGRSPHYSLRGLLVDYLRLRSYRGSNLYIDDLTRIDTIRYNDYWIYAHNKQTLHTLYILMCIGVFHEKNRPGASVRRYSDLQSSADWLGISDGCLLHHKTLRLLVVRKAFR